MIRNPILLTRIFFVLIATLVGLWVGRGYATANGVTRAIEYSTYAFFLSIFCVIVEISTSVIPSKKIVLAAAGLIVGLVIAWFVYPTIPLNIFAETVVDGATGGAERKARILCNLLFGYFGVILAIKHANRFSFSRLNFVMANPSDMPRILDTSVIVDGRVKELITTGFLPGNFIVPEFVLEELQKIADSSDAKRRARGRRGLEMLEQIKDSTPRLAILEKDYPDQKDVDHKLIELAKEIGGELMTNDYNLQKVAVLHKVRVLNVNELANLLKPSVYVGETFTLHISKEGKDWHQGVGYLDDGTMVVVEDARSRIGSDVEVAVTSILQNPAGRMIFGRAVAGSPPPTGPYGSGSAPAASGSAAAAEVTSAPAPPAERAPQHSQPPTPAPNSAASGTHPAAHRGSGRARQGGQLSPTPNSHRN